MPPHSIKPLIVETEPVVLAGLSISHYLSCRGVLPAHTSAGLDMLTFVAIHQPQPTKPHNYVPKIKNYILVQDHGHIYMLSSLTCRWRSSSVSMFFLQCHCPKETSVFISQYQKTNMCLVIKTRSTFTAFAH